MVVKLHARDFIKRSRSMVEIIGIGLVKCMINRAVIIFHRKNPNQTKLLKKKIYTPLK